MLNLLLGTDWVANRDAILNRIASDTKNKCGNRILIVPELISHDTERRLCDFAGDTASRYVEVLSFSRLVDRVVEVSGNRMTECLDNGGRIVAMAAAVRQLHSKLKAYASLETRPEFLSDLVSAVDEFKCCMIKPANIFDASKSFEGSTAQKLEEIALIYEAYDSICSRGKQDPRDRMTWLLEQLEDSDFAQNHVFYIDGFPDFTRQHMAVLEHLLRCSQEVTVSLNCDKLNSIAVAFEKAGDTAAQILRYAREYGVDVRIETVPERKSELSSVRNMLFESKPEDLGLGSLVCAYRTETIRQECVAAAEKILSLVQSGCRYRDICVVCADMAAYKNTIDMVFRRCGIPVYLSGFRFPT